MPLKIIQNDVLSPIAIAIQNELVAELRQPKDTGQPLILERHMNRRGAVHVYVIWDRLADCPDNERPEIVMGAFEQIRGEEFRKHIVLAIGLTVPEAVEMGVLPFGIVSTARDSDRQAPEKLINAMIEEGASTLDHPQRPLLRYPALEDAEAALARLNARIGAPNCFAIIQELR